jgi:hypothetical protein
MCDALNIAYQQCKNEIDRSLASSGYFSTHFGSGRSFEPGYIQLAPEGPKPRR